jgi:flagellar biogenesis protein FliO
MGWLRILIGMILIDYLIIFIALILTVGWIIKQLIRKITNGRNNSRRQTSRKDQQRKIR